MFFWTVPSSFTRSAATISKISGKAFTFPRNFKIGMCVREWNLLQTDGNHMGMRKLLSDGAPHTTQFLKRLCLLCTIHRCLLCFALSCFSKTEKAVYLAPIIHIGKFPEVTLAGSIHRYDFLSRFSSTTEHLPVFKPNTDIGDISAFT